MKKTWVLFVYKFNRKDFIEYTLVDNIDKVEEYLRIKYEGDVALSWDSEMDETPANFQYKIFLITSGYKAYLRNSVISETLHLGIKSDLLHIP